MKSTNIDLRRGGKVNIYRNPDQNVVLDLASEIFSGEYVLNLLRYRSSSVIKTYELTATDGKLTWKPENSDFKGINRLSFTLRKAEGSAAEYVNIYGDIETTENVPEKASNFEAGGDNALALVINAAPVPKAKAENPGDFEYGTFTLTDDSDMFDGNNATITVRGELRYKGGDKGFTSSWINFGAKKVEPI